MLKTLNKYAKVVSQVEAEDLLSHAFRCSRSELYLNERSVDKKAEELCDFLIRRRLSREPLQYIIGSTEFMGLNFLVNRDVFIPRPETELLVNEVWLSAISYQLSAKCSLLILDLCTGCGNIAISLAHTMPKAKIVATDISERALETARKNSAAHKVDTNITLYKGDLFNALPFDKRYKFDIIVCNPPYVKSAELETLQKEVRHEPKIALDGGEDGLLFYRRIAKSARHYLKKKGALFLEIGFGQVESAMDIFRCEKIFKIQRIKRDFAGIERVLWISLL